MKRRITPPREFRHKHEPGDIPGLDIERIRILRDERVKLFREYRRYCQARSQDEALPRAAQIAYREESAWALGQIAKTIKKAVQVKHKGSVVSEDYVSAIAESGGEHADIVRHIAERHRREDGADGGSWKRPKRCATQMTTCDLPLTVMSASCAGHSFGHILRLDV